MRPADVSGGYVGICRTVRTLAEARHEATRYVADAARAEIARAYVEAVTEHVERAAVKAEAAGAPTWRADTARRMIGYTTQGNSGQWIASVINQVRQIEMWTAEYSAQSNGARMTTGHAPTGLCLRTTRAHVGHMKAVTVECRETDEDYAAAVTAGQTCTSITIDDSHPFEHQPAEVAAVMRGNSGYDEWERCAKTRDHEVHQPPASAERYAAEAPAADELVHYWPAADGSSTDKQYGELAACGVDIMRTPYTFGSPKWDEVTCGQCLTVQPPVGAAKGEHFTDRFDITEAGRTYLLATETIEASRAPSDAKPSALPPVPGSVYDHDAWAEYIDALPEPTGAELARVRAEFSNASIQS